MSDTDTAEADHGDSTEDEPTTRGRRCGSSTPTTDTEDTDEDQDDEDADTFPRAYVEELRRENARLPGTCPAAPTTTPSGCTPSWSAPPGSWPTRPTSSSTRNTSTTPTPWPPRRRPAGPQAAPGVTAADRRHRTGRLTSGGE